MKSSTLKHFFILLLLLMLAGLKAGCGGGGGDSVAGGGIGGTGVTVASVGTATGFGSVIVNGVTYDTSAAEVFVEGASMGSGDQSLVQNISIGQVVRVEGKLAKDGTEIADRVFFSYELKGPVESISELDAVSKQAVILGQKVLMDDRTVLQNTNAALISIGMVLGVSGFVDESGIINATYINKIADSLPPETSVAIIGLVQDPDPKSKTFTINLLTVDYATANLSELPGNAPESGQRLWVIGRLASTNLLIAERLEPEEEFGSGVFDAVDLEGIIAQVVAPSELKIGRYTVTIDSETVYKNLKPGDLNRGTRVIVQGTLTNRTILADVISLPENIRMESNVRSINLAENSLTLSGLESATAFAGATTRIIGIGSELNQIRPGDHVRLLGRRTSNGNILASSLLVTPSSKTIELAGPVESISEPSIVILGVQVNTASIPSDRFKGMNGSPVSSAEFFEILKIGDAVAVEGTLQGESLSWEKIAIE
jgi:hypothetical protein